MAPAPLDILGFGNAIVDVIAEASDAFLTTHDIPKGGMMLIDEAKAKSIYDDMAPGVEISGGSNANAIACAASLGARAGFVGKVADDALGEIFAHDLRAISVDYATAPLSGGPGTGRCLVTVTPDAQRSMATFLGAAGFVSPDDILEEDIARASISFFEGYLFEQPNAREAFVAACELARRHDNRTALTLSDVGCVERQGDVIRSFVKAHIDILLANENEARALFGVDALDEMVEAARAFAPLVAITRSERGAVLVPRDGPAIELDARAPEALIDTTGAGDAFAGGLLTGLARGRSLAEAGALGALAASEVISHFGARPARSLAEFANETGL